MTAILIDPSLRRARLVRLVGLTAVAAIGAILALFGLSLTPSPRAPLSLPSPRRALAHPSRRPDSGRNPDSRTDPDSGRTRAGGGSERVRSGERARAPIVVRGRMPPPGVGRRELVSSVRSSPRATSAERPAAAPAVIAFVDPTVPGALVSLDRHASAVAQAAFTGLLVGEDARVIDRLDPAALDVARSHAIPALALVQNLDEKDGDWRPDRVERLARHRSRRARFAASVAEACRRHDLAGVHLDLEEIEDDDWTEVSAIVADVSRALRADGRETALDVPAHLDRDTLRQLAAVVDRIVVMAYDEADEHGAPGAIATEPFVEATLAAVEDAVPAEKRVAGLGIYGYDWVGSSGADPVSFVDAMAAAKEARVDPSWDAARGSPHVRFSDEEGAHEIWLLDGATLWNQLRIVSLHHVPFVALWRLGGEDPGVWEALAGAGRPASEVAESLAAVAADDRVDNLGDGPFLSLALSPEAGHRNVSIDQDRIVDERWVRLPSPFLVRRAGIQPGQVALTFDDGPDPRYTPAILDILRDARAPATFFVVGANAESAPGLVQRAFAEGHEIGNHSFTHPNVDAIDDQRLRLELELTSRLVETLIGRRPLLYRPPSLADIEPRTGTGAAAFARAGSLGYLVVDADVDPRDFEATSPADLAARVVAGAHGGGVVLLHDAGGDRAATVAALPAIIEGVRARGLEIVPLSRLVKKSRDEVMPVAEPRSAASAIADHAVFAGASVTLRVASACLAVSLVLLALRALLVSALAISSEHRRRRRRVRFTDAAIPSVTVVIPVFNEREVIVRTIESVLASDMPIDVIVVDDGSTDDTALVVARRFGRDPRVALVTQRNGGKAAALRSGFAHAHTEVVVALDGDTLFRPDTVRLLVAPFADPRVGAVAGTAEVGNVCNLLTGVQELEYLVQQEVERRAWHAVTALPVVPGAVGAWRRAAVALVGGFSSVTLAEDADLAMALCRAGWRIVYEPRALARTEAPESVTALVRQRVRWTFGVLQAMWKHRAALAERRSGAFGRVVLPSMILFQVLLPLLAPAATVAALAAAVAGNFRPALVATAVLLVVELGQALLACTLGRRGWRLLPLLVVGKLVYRPILIAVLARSLARVLDGVPLGWNKLARSGGVMP